MWGMYACRVLMIYFLTERCVQYLVIVSQILGTINAIINDRRQSVNGT